jgi:hypothetical protein
MNIRSKTEKFGVSSKTTNFTGLGFQIEYFERMPAGNRFLGNRIQK